LYIPVFYKAEIEGARKLMQLAAYPVRQLGDNDTPLFDRMGHEYSSRQREAIRLLLDSPVAVLTGGPGTGKTTVLRGVIEIFEQHSLKVVLAAPTGRAAKRMTTLTGVEASTIHRLLGYTPSEGYRHRKIATDVLIIDEGSMMEQVLLDHLLEAVALGTRIIIVGDVDQLPAIGAGDVLRDLINSGAVPVARLDANFRQEEGSRIASGATDINRGRLPVSDEESDFMIIPEPTAQRIHDRILTLMAYELPEKRGIAPTDIRVVTPQQIGLLGARQLNKDLQRQLNPDAPGITRGLTTFRVGDPVMQTANSRERGLYNGDVGIVYNVDEELQTVTVEFPDRRMSVYARSELSEIVLAYAMTVHKLQGSEVKYMIFPITMDHKPMLYRNLIYTGVSRATRLCVLVGEIEALQYAIDNNPDSTRHTNFGRRLQEYRQTAGSTASGSLIGAESDALHAPDGAPGK
ncbi:MAG: AAA family ATPase, partial [Muribaculaceae bacterium]|nr:AAA family ATPase [Muribaculaceae bacterium]